MKVIYVDHNLRLAYLAGFLEADGCFLINNSGISVRAANKHLPTLNRLIEWFGGTIYTKSSPSNCWDWRIHGQVAADLCEQLLPYLSMKKAAAECLISFQKTVGKRGKKLTPEVIAVRLEIRNTLKNTRNYENHVC